MSVIDQYNGNPEMLALVGQALLGTLPTVTRAAAPLAEAGIAPADTAPEILYVDVPSARHAITTKGTQIAQYHLDRARAHFALFLELHAGELRANPATPAAEPSPVDDESEKEPALPVAHDFLSLDVTPDAMHATGAGMDPETLERDGLEVAVVALDVDGGRIVEGIRPVPPTED